MNENGELIATDVLQNEAEQRSAMIERQADQVMGRNGLSRMRLWLSPEDKQRIRSAVARELEMGFEYRREAIAMALEMRLQSFREACNQVLVDGKTRLRRQRLEYFTRTYAEVERHINQLTGEFLDELDERFGRIARFRSPVLRDREQQRLERRMDDFLQTFDRLMANFANILDEQIGGHARSEPLADAPSPVLRGEPAIDVTDYEEENDAAAGGDHCL